MIIIGTYPDSFEQSEQKPLTFLYSILSKFVPKDVAIHILPIHPSSGDSGFAPDDWFNVDPRLGKLSDLKQLTSEWRIIIDCIYNHVGINHPLVKSFFSKPYNYKHLFYAYQTDSNKIAPTSPRGDNVLKEYYINGERWLIWQTFHLNSIDIRLESREIINLIDQHLDFLKKLGLFGVRLDGAAYYAKVFTDKEARHSKKAHFLTRQMYETVSSKKLEVCVQLDCDSDGIKYLPSKLEYNVPVVDFSHSALMAYTILSEDVEPLKEHLEKFGNYNLIRCLRTHDGILFRSKNLDKRIVHFLKEFSQENQIPLRLIGDSPYELNCSIPYMFSINHNLDIGSKRIKLCLALAAMLNGWCYVYLPLLFNDIPEEKYKYESDVRVLNRSKIQKKSFNYASNQSLFESLNSFLNDLTKVNSLVKGKRIISVPFKHCIAIDCPSIKLKFIGNFSLNKSIEFNNLKSTIISSSPEKVSQTIEPLGYHIFNYN